MGTCGLRVQIKPGGNAELCAAATQPGPVNIGAGPREQGAVHPEQDGAGHLAQCALQELGLQRRVGAFWKRLVNLPLYASPWLQCLGVQSSPSSWKEAKAAPNGTGGRSSRRGKRHSQPRR